MKKYIKYVSLLMAVLICLSMIFTGCEGNNKTDINSGPEESGKPQFIKNETESQITVIDPLNNEVILDKRPKRVVILMNSILDLWYLAGGTAVARVTGEENVPPEAEDIETVGGFGNPIATTKSVQCELPSSLVGDMVRMLGADNIVEDSPVKGATKVEFSMERIVERDPDVILITTMSDVEKCKARIKEDIESNKAWAGLRAVKEGNVHYLVKAYMHGLGENEAFRRIFTEKALKTVKTMPEEK